MRRGRFTIDILIAGLRLIRRSCRRAGRRVFRGDFIWARMQVKGVPKDDGGGVALIRPSKLSIVRNISYHALLTLNPRRDMG